MGLVWPLRFEFELTHSRTGPVQVCPWLGNVRRWPRHNTIASVSHVSMQWSAIGCGTAVRDGNGHANTVRAHSQACAQQQNEASECKNRYREAQGALEMKKQGQSGGSTGNQLDDFDPAVSVCKVSGLDAHAPVLPAAQKGSSGEYAASKQQAAPSIQRDCGAG